MLPEIRIKVIPAIEQRYDTVGDYYEDHRGRLQLRVSDMRNGDYEVLVLVHELLEWYLCRRAGIQIKEIDEFDMRFERERLEGKHKLSDEPGHDPRAPYGWAHKFAERIERLVAKKLGVRWDIYSARVESL